MEIDDYSFHDAEIMEAKELIGHQTIEYLINFPINWDDNEFEYRILRFTDVVKYCIDEIPFEGTITILEIQKLEINGITSSTIGTELTHERKNIEILTNAGKRIICYSEFLLLEP